MMRLLRVLSVSALTLAVATNVFAEPPEAGRTSISTEASCPQGRLSIYYAPGEAAVSQQAEALIGLISEHALACKADGLDIIARIDARVDGQAALSLALQRLSDVSGALVQRGVLVEAIRVAAQAASSPAFSNLNQVDVIFRKDDPADEVAAPASRDGRTVPSEAI